MSTPLISSVQIFCPICSKMGMIDVEEKIINQSNSGITAININQELICNHSFVAYVDKNLIVRDCFVCDFMVQLPQIQVELPSTPSGPPVDLDIIKYNLLPSLMVNIIVGVKHNKKLVVINELEFLNDIFLKFFDYVFQDSFKHDISFISEKDYKKKKKDYKKYIVLKGNEIVLDKEKIFR